VLAFSGGAFSGRASSNVEHYDDRPISSFDIENGEYVWTSDFAYKTFFAVANGVIYAGKDDPVALDAIDEITGEVLWSWVAPSTTDTEFHRNVIVTKNLLFVSTNAHLYAIDLESREVVWSYDEPGMIAISDNRILLLAPGYRESDGRLLAFDLRTR
jgi:outer membrane protein assembly factor BamB